MSETLQEKFVRVANRVAKWRAHFAGWQLGTRFNEDPECQAVRDQREMLIALRAEVSALFALLRKKGVFTADEQTEQCIEELEHLEKTFEKRFPGVKATDMGLEYSSGALEHMKHWRR